MFNKIIVENFSNPVYQGEIRNPQLRMEIGNPVCGDKMLITIETCNNGLTIGKAAFQAWGCATSIATANIFCGYITGKRLAELQALDDNQVSNLLGELEPSQQHCLDMLLLLFEQLERDGPEGD